MKTKKTKNPAKPKGPEMTQVQIQVAKDPEARQGLRGLRGMVFGEFGKAKDLAHLPTRDELTAKVAEQFPQSRWIARPKIHYSYYKSKFLQSVKVK